MTIKVRFPPTSKPADSTAESCPCSDDCPIWEDAQGETYYICEMSTDHLQRALTYLRRVRREAGCYWPQGEMAQLYAEQAEDEMDALDDAMSCELHKRSTT